MADLLQDLRFSLRRLLRAPGFTIAAAATLGLGIGATTAIFTVANGVLLRPLPYPESDAVVRVFQVDEDRNRMHFAEPNFVDVRERSRSFEALAQFQTSVVSVSGSSEPGRVVAAVVSRDFLRVLGVDPLIGRGFLEEEQTLGASPVVLVSSRYWDRYLGADPELSRHTLRFQERLHTVVGVMPPGFEFPAGADLWVPRELLPAETSRTAHNWQVVGRLAGGRTLEQARQETSTIAGSLAAEHGDDTWMSDAAVVPLQEQMVASVRPALLLLAGGAVLLLLIACANVVNLLLVRATSRERELAVRLALGAGRGRIARQFLSEALVLCLLGGGLGALLAFWAVDLLLALGGGDLPRAEQVRVDGTVLLFTLAVSSASAVALGVTTAWRATRGHLEAGVAGSAARGDGGGSGQLLRRALVVSQVALAIVLLLGAGLLGRSFLHLVNVDPGFRTEGAVVMNVSLPHPGLEESPRLANFHQGLMERLGALPGVEAVGGASDFPLLGGNYASGVFLVLNHPEEISDFETFGLLSREPERVGYAEFRVTSPGYFRAMEIPLLRGRLFENWDGPDAPHVAVVSESLADAQWPGEDPLGKLVQFGNMDGDLRAFTIVGVVGDVHEVSLEAEPRPTFYGHYLQRPSSTANFTIVMAGSGDHRGLIPAAREILRSLDPEIPPSFRTLEQVFAAALADRRFSLLLLGTFGLGAFLLAVTGIYGTISFSVAQRTREMGVRMALGAHGRHVTGLVVRQGLILTGIGAALGVAAATVLGQLIRGLLFGVTPLDGLTFGAVPLLLVTVALVASYMPARRAARVDPVVALKSE